MLTATTSNSRPTSNVEHAERADQPVEHLRAQHRALVIHQREDHRALAEELAEPHLAAGLVGEREIERDLLVQLLIDTDLAQQPRLRLRRIAGVVWRQPLRARRPLPHGGAA